MKKEGDGSTDEQLLSMYVEIDSGSYLKKTLTGRIHSEDCILDMDYMFLAMGVEVVIQVFTVTAVDSPHHVRFFASRDCDFLGQLCQEGRAIHTYCCGDGKSKFECLLGMGEFSSGVDV